MLGTLAKWMRIYGLDTFYANNEIDDSNLIEICNNEGRVLITRDKNLIQRARREKIKTIEIRTTDINKQIKKAIPSKEINQRNVLSRCVLCNTLVDEIKKEEVEGKIPKKVFDKQDKFWICRKCNKIYWKGSHYDNMVEKIRQIKNL